MPDPLIYGQAIGAASLVSVVAALVFWFALRPITDAIRPGLLTAFAISLGLVAGYWGLGQRLQWPPVNALDRLLLIVVPLAAMVEIVAGVKRTPTWLAWTFRAGLAAATPRILLHGSIYVTGVHDDWTPLAAMLLLATTAAILAASWGCLGLLNRRSPGIGVPASLAMAMLGAGLTIMMSGYLRGGAASFPFLGAVFASSLLVFVLEKHRPSFVPWESEAEIGLGVIGLFGLLFIGRFFGELSTTNALVILLSPALGWVTQLPKLRDQRPWVVVLVQLILTAIPLAIVLLLAKQEFDREMAPLLTLLSEKPCGGLG